ncbi:MAG TPA: DinB family protein [Pyrinomonadaceae bacterium]|nr:DinB family protein [Pyrinomonadaceae bacterium]
MAATTEGPAEAPEPLVSDLEDFRRLLEAVSVDARDLTAELTDEQFNWRPAPGQWSIAECLDHLTQTGRVAVGHIRETLADARRRKLYSRGPFRYGMLGQMIVRSMGPRPRMKFKAPAVFRPRPDRARQDVERDFFALQDELLGCIRESNGINLKRAKVTSPVTKLLRLSLGQEFALLIAHEQRHLWQARQVRASPAFPPAQRH